MKGLKGIAVCVDKECTPMYQSDSGEADNIDSRIAEVEYHTIPHDKADVVTALAAVTGL